MLGPNTVVCDKLNSTNIGNHSRLLVVSNPNKVRYRLGRVAQRLHNNGVKEVGDLSQTYILPRPKKSRKGENSISKVVPICNQVQGPSKVQKYNNYAEYMTNKTAEAAKDEGKKVFYPTKAQLIKKNWFGKPDRNHSYNGEKVFEHTLVHLLKSGFCGEDLVKNLRLVRPNFNVVINILAWSKNIPFETLKLEGTRYQTQKKLSIERQRLLTACLLHYDLHVPSVIRYLDGKYIPNHRKIKETIKVLQQ